MAIITVTSENFEEEVLKSEEVVLVDFWAAWCGPCKMLSPVLEEIDNEIANVKIAKINIDEQMALARKYKVMSIPALKVFKNGEVVNETVGVQPKEELVKLMEV